MRHVSPILRPWFTVSAERNAKEPFGIVDARFVAAAVAIGSLPGPVGVEIAFAGRSNVGKSSLINALVERKNLVRTSGRPGATRQLNVFEARARDGAVLGFVDLPGYGYAQRSKTERQTWAELIDDYLTTRVTLAAVVLIVDARRGLEEDDMALIEFITTMRVPSRRPVEVVLVATKIDKLPRSAWRTEVERIGKAAGRRVIAFSAETGEGRSELLRAIRKSALGGLPGPTENR